MNPLAAVAADPPRRAQAAMPGTSSYQKLPAASLAPSEATAKDELLKRVGLSLQRMLKDEYGDALKKDNVQDIMQIRNPRLANIPPAEALAALKRELKAYARDSEPFDRKMRPGQTVKQWWGKVAKDIDARVLGVSSTTLYCFTVTLTSVYRLLLKKYFLWFPTRWRMSVLCPQLPG